MRPRAVPATKHLTAVCNGFSVMQIILADRLPTAFTEADFSFDVDSVVVAPFDAVPLRVASLPSRQKVYGLDNALFDPRDSKVAGLFVAEEGGAFAGYIAVSRAWNGCAEIDDLAIARPFRRRGLATSLMNKAVSWTYGAGLSAIRLETQSNNVAACNFYQRYGFMLGGYDRFLYRELNDETSEEIALFWYLNLQSSPLSESDVQ
jgi:ribosomal protein S18 acetylase RimI-like enzyme